MKPRIATRLDARSELSTPKVQLIWISAAALGLFLMLLLLNTYFLKSEDNASKHYIKHAGELRLYSQSIANLATQAVQGQRQAFTTLEAARNAYQRHLDVLKNGDAVDGIAPSDNVDLVNNISRNWQSLSKQVQFILAHEQGLLTLTKVAKRVHELMPNMQRENDALISVLVEEGASQQQISAAVDLAWLSIHITRTVDHLVSSTANSIFIDGQFKKDIERFSQILQDLNAGNASIKIARLSSERSRRYLTNMQKIYIALRKDLQPLLQESDDLSKVHAVLNDLFLDSSMLFGLAGNLTKKYTDSQSEFSSRVTFNYILSLVGILTLIFMLYAFYQYSMQQSHIARSKNEEQKQAILRLINELSNLAHGDLRVHASVSSDITAAIAESFNFAINALRKLVNSINQVAVQVSRTATDTQSRALGMVKTITRQTQEMSEASRLVNSMAESISGVSGDASVSAQVAQKALDLALKGAGAVQDTMQGMDTIRAQILETSKRLKRLGERSQEIGDIVVFMRDIAERTNLLALNASIQATLAGEEGRGFAIIAEQVQHLAERSHQATRQIENLVSGIQGDTHEAIHSMEQSTSLVVNGADLAQHAGLALSEIEQVSGELAKMIESIAHIATEEANSASSVAKTMQAMQEASHRSAKGVADTATSIGKLSSQAKELRHSVAGFKLPQENK